MAKSSTGLDENVAGLLCYVLGWVSGLVFFLLETESKFVKFHAMQSIVVFGALHIIFIILAWIPIIGWIFRIIIGIIVFILWLILMIKANRGQKYKVKWAGDFAEKQVR